MGAEVLVLVAFDDDDDDDVSGDVIIWNEEKMNALGRKKAFAVVTVLDAIIIASDELISDLKLTMIKVLCMVSLCY